MSISWDDYRMFIVLVENKTLYNSAKKLQINHTTILRRMKSLEEKLKTRLFERTKNGYILTVAGEELYKDIKGLDEKLETAQRKILGQDVEPKGNIRVAASDTLGFMVLPDLIAKFQKNHPQITIELIISPQFYDLSRREADVAIRVSNNPSLHLFGRKIANLEMAVMSAKKVFSKKISFDEIKEQGNWIVGCEQLLNHSSNNWLMSNIKKEQFIAGANQMMGIARLVESGVGYGVMPAYLAKIIPNLVIVKTLAELNSALWILTHEDLKNNARIKILMEFLYKELGKLIS